LALRDEFTDEIALRPGCDAFHLVPCPLGTGNDLARSLGWGHAFSGLNKLGEFTKGAQKAALGPALDIWHVHFGRTAPKMRRMQNYLSIGCDAEVARRFDVARTQRPEAFRSALKNKVTYASLGADLALCGARSLEHRIQKLCIDDKVVAVPQGCKSVVLLNIPSFGAGTHPWGDGPAEALPPGGKRAGCMPLAHRRRQFDRPAVDDGRLEVIALFGIMDAALMHVPITWKRLRGYGAKRLGQGASVTFTFVEEDHYATKRAKEPSKRSDLAAQVDGEAWSFPCWGEEVKVTWHGRVGAPCGPRHVEHGGWPWAAHAYANEAAAAEAAAKAGIAGKRELRRDSTDPRPPGGQLHEPVLRRG
jgi:hypothetical protein